MIVRSLTCLFLALPACAAAQESPEALQAAFLDAIRAGDADALAALYSADAVSYSVGNMVATGPDGVRSDWGPFFDAYTVTDIAVKDSHTEVMGDTAVAWGLWTMTFVSRDDGEAITMDGRYMDMARKIDGNWRYVVDHASLPLPAEDGH